MSFLQLYPGLGYIKGKLIKRDNRFVMTLLYKGKELKAHVPNTGRMEEFLYPEAEFFLVPSGGKYPYKVVSTFYDNCYILLDTIKTNSIIEHLIRKGFFPQFKDFLILKREVPFKNSKFDFFLKGRKQDQLIEVKSCTLQYNKLLMFPDAPTERGRKHLIEMEEISNENKSITSYILYLTTHYYADSFIPNLHTDPQYAELFQNLKLIQPLVYKIKMVRPDLIDLNSLSEVSINHRLLDQNLYDSGIYILILENKENFSIKVGAIGEKFFKKGFYIYAGSGKKHLQSRIKRHSLKRKKTYWHLDYILPSRMKLIKTYAIRSKLNNEIQLVQKLQLIYNKFIPDFGSSDSKAGSHLFYTERNPIFTKKFQRNLLSFRMFT